MGPITEHHLMLFLMQFALLLGVCKLAGWVFEKFKQSSVTAELLVGIVFGPAILGKLAPEVQGYLFPNDVVQRSMLETIAWFGNFFLLMETGLEINLSRVWQQRGEAIKLSSADLAIPILVCFLPVFFLWTGFTETTNQQILFALFISAIMTISALPVAIRGMRDLNILKTDVGFLILSALTLNDIAGWVIFTIILGLFAHGSLELGFMAKLVGYTLLFTVISLTLMRKLVDKAITFIHERIGEATGLKITFIMIVGAIFGAITLRIGIHSLFGFFIAGTILGEAKDLSEKDRFVVNRLVYSIFVPIFFASIGLHLDFIANFDIGMVLFITALGIAARFAGAYVGSKWAKQEKGNLVTIAICHTPGGQMHIVVGMLAYSSGLISERIFVSIVGAAILSTIVFGPWLSHAVRKLNRSKFRIIFNNDEVDIDDQSNTREETLQVMSQKVAHVLKLSRSYVYQEIKAREDQMSTSWGRSVAVPHARLDKLDESHLFVFVNRRGIDWDSPDGDPAKLIILILTPKSQPDAQIQILHILASALRHKKLRAQLMGTSDKQQIWRTLHNEISACQQCLID